MTPSTFLVILLQTGVVLLVGVIASLLTRKVPTLRLAVGRVALLAALGLVIATPWIGERAKPVVAVDWQPSAPVIHYLSAEEKPVLKSEEKPVAAAAAVPKALTAEPTKSVESYDLSNLLTPLWLIGVGLLAAHLGLGYLALAGVRRRSVVVQEARLQAILAVAGKEAGVPTPRLVASDRIGAPFVAGILRPTVFIPAGWSDNLDDEALKAVLRHEVAHIANGDLQWGLLHRMACILLWPQPFIWLLRSPMNSASEELCDRHVLASGVSGVRYAECLLSLRENLTNHRYPSVAIGAVSKKSALSHRIEAILDARRSRLVRVSRPVATMTRVGALALAGGAAFVFARPSAVQDDPFKDWIVKPYTQTVRIVGPDGKPVKGASAWLQLVGDTPTQAYRRLKVNGNEIALSPNGATDEAGTLIVQAKGLGLGVKRVWPVKAKVAEIRLSKSVSISGRLKAPLNWSAAGIPLHVTMVVRHTPGSAPTETALLGHLKEINLDTKTNAQGEFTLSGLSAGTNVAFDVDDARFSQLKYTDRVDIAADGKSERKNIQLHGAAQIAGRVLRNGKPVEGMMIGAQGTNASIENVGNYGYAITDKNGNYTIKRLNAGVYNVALDIREPLSQQVTAVAFEALQVRERQSLTGLNFELIPGAVLEGRVLDSAGLPIPRTWVGVYGPAHPRSGAWVQGVKTDGDGHYRMRVPEGKQYVYCSDSRYTNDGHNVTVKNGSTHTVDIHVNARRQEEAAPEAQPSEEAVKEQDDSRPTPAVMAFEKDAKPFYGPARLSTGAMVSLAYVQDDEDRPHTLWKPDGSPASPRDVQKSLSLRGFASRSSGARRMFARLKLENAPSGTNIQIQVPHPSNHNVWQTYGDSERPMRSMDLASFHAARTLRQTDMRIGVATSPYAVVARGALGKAPLNARLVSRPDDEIRGVRPEVSLAHVEVAIPASLEGQDVTLDAFDASGRALTLHSLELDTDAKSRTRVYGFRLQKGQTLSSVTLAARKYEWVTFRGIHLNPAN